MLTPFMCLNTCRSVLDSFKTLWPAPANVRLCGSDVISPLASGLPLPLPRPLPPTCSPGIPSLYLTHLPLTSSMLVESKRTHMLHLLQCSCLIGVSTINQPCLLTCCVCLTNWLMDVVIYWNLQERDLMIDVCLWCRQVCFVLCKSLCIVADVVLVNIRAIVSFLVRAWKLCQTLISPFLQY